MTTKKLGGKKKSGEPSQPGGQGWAGLLGTIVTSWPNTVRTLVITVVVVLVVAVVLWWLNDDLTAGPISVTGRGFHSAPAVSSSPHHSSG